MLDLELDVDCDVMLTTVEGPTDFVCDTLTVDDVGGGADVDVCLPVALVVDFTLTSVAVEEGTTLESVPGDGDADALGLGVMMTSFEEVIDHVVEDIDDIEAVVVESISEVDNVALKRDIGASLVLAIVELMSDVKLSEDDGKVVVVDKEAFTSGVAATVTFLPVEGAVGECAVVDREESKPDVDDDAITVVVEGEVELAATEGVISLAVVLLTRDTEAEETGN